MRQNLHILPLALLTAALLAAPALFTGLPAPARAAGDPAETAAPADRDSPSQAAIDDRDIDAFAGAAGDVRRVRVKWLPRMQAAARQGAQAEIATEQQAMEEMAAVVVRHGLSVDKYNQIVDLADSDPLIQDRIAQKLLQNEQLSQQPGDREESDDQDSPPRPQE